MKQHAASGTLTRTRAGSGILGIVLATASATAALTGAVLAETGLTASDAVPPATSLASPAEIQPGHPPPAETGSLGAAGANLGSPPAMGVPGTVPNRARSGRH